MSEFIQRLRVTDIWDHPDADNLAIVKVGEYTVCHSKEQASKYRKGQIVIHVPPNICICPVQADALGVASYLKRANYNGEDTKTHCWVRSVRLRGVASMGFIIDDCTVDDEDLDVHFGVFKYEPTLIEDGGDILYKEHMQFPKYTKIKHIRVRPDAWIDNTPVRVTEKLHGQNCRLGIIKTGDEWEFMVGSHNVIKTQSCRKWWDLMDVKVMNLLSYLCEQGDDCIIYCERVGPGTQDLDYGLDKVEIRVYDIQVGGKYLDWDLVRAHCEQFEIPTVPVLYTGGFSWCMVNAHTDGLSLVTNPGSIKSVFKGREGIVITPLEETYSDILGGRLIGKSVSVDYESRRGGTEYS